MTRGLVLLAAVLGACSERIPRDTTKLASFGVKLRSPAGSPDSPLPFSVREDTTFVIDVEARDARGLPLPTYNGQIAVSVVPGEIVAVAPAEPQLSSGVREGIEVTVRKSFGPTNLWVEDRSGQNPFAVGVSPTIWFQNPRIWDIQQPLTRGDSPLAGSVVSVDRGKNVVVHVSNAGFYVVDTTVDPCSADRDAQNRCPAGATCCPIGIRCDLARGRCRDDFKTIFAFNFNRPEGLLRGDVLRRFGGSVSEFLGFTELGFPHWDVERRCPSADFPGQVCDEGEFCVDGACLGQVCGEVVCGEGSVCRDEVCVPNPNIPDPVLNPPLLVSAEMEKYEGGLVRFGEQPNVSAGVMLTREFKACDDPAVNPGANGNGECEFCRTCNSNRDQNGACPSGGRCCPVGRVCNIRLGECTTTCNADLVDGVCPATVEGPDGRTVAGRCCPAGNTCESTPDGRMCDGCTVAERREQECEDECAQRSPSSPNGICTSVCDFRQFGQYRVGLLNPDGRWNGATFLMVTQDTVPFFRPDAPENAGKRLRSVTGTLRNIFAPGPLWIVEPRDECDLDGIEHVRKDCATVK